jgi:hypothetical protein
MVQLKRIKKRAKAYSQKEELKMANINVYNVICYDGVDAYCIKTIGKNNYEVETQFENTDLEITKIDYLYSWDDLGEHIKVAMDGKCKLGDGDKDLEHAIRRFLDCRLGFDCFNSEEGFKALNC